MFIVSPARKKCAADTLRSYTARIIVKENVFKDVQETRKVSFLLLEVNL